MSFQETVISISNLGIKPFYENESVALFQGDCIELLKCVPSETFDLTVTSPPYNIGKEYEEVMSSSEFVNWCEKWISHIYDATTKRGSFWLNLGYLEVPQRGKCVPISYLLWDKSLFYLMQEVVWNYGAGVAAKKYLSPRNEKFLWFVVNSEDYVFNLDDIRDKNVKYPNQKKKGKLRCNPRGKNPSDVWQFPKVTSGQNRSSKERTLHPAQFPEAVIDRIIKASSNAGDLILDPFMGSGTTAITAIKNDRKCIGFELREDYLNISVSRIEEFLNKGSICGQQ